MTKLREPLDEDGTEEVEDEATRHAGHLVSLHILALLAAALAGMKPTGTAVHAPQHTAGRGTGAEPDPCLPRPECLPIHHAAQLAGC